MIIESFGYLKKGTYVVDVSYTKPFDLSISWDFWASETCKIFWRLFLLYEN